VLPFFITALALLALAAPAHAAFPGANGKIAYWSGTYIGGGEIWTVNPDGSNNVDITNTGSALEKSPSWSPDGTQIAYVRDRAIWRMNADGSGQTQVVPAPPLTNNCVDQPCTGLSDPAWSPDGSKLVFDSFRHVHDEFAGELPYDELHTVNPDGTGEALLVTQAKNPRWSPDGAKIGYTFSCDGGGCTDVRWVTADGSQQFLVYQTHLAAETFIDWSPDGSLIDGCGEGYCFTIHSDGNEFTQFPSGAPGHWSPDGTKMTVFGYVVGPPGQYDIFTINAADGSAPTNITNTTSANEFGPDWQPIPTTSQPSPQRSDYKNAAQFCKAERDFLGDEAFTKKYGTNGNGANAYGKCVSAN
jgi:TolB protein